MRHFLKIAQGMDVLPLMHTLMRKSHLWGEKPARTASEGSPHVEAKDILLRFEDVAGACSMNELDHAPMIWHPAWYELPEVRLLIAPLIARVAGYELGRVMLTKLEPGDSIRPHADVLGDYAETPDMARYHIAVQGLPGSMFHVDRESVQMLTGEAWWIHNRVTHSVINNSADDRIHLIVDMRVAP